MGTFKDVEKENPWHEQCGRDCQLFQFTDQAVYIYIYQHWIVDPLSLMQNAELCAYLRQVDLNEIRAVLWHGKIKWDLPPPDETEEHIEWNCDACNFSFTSRRAQGTHLWFSKSEFGKHGFRAAGQVFTVTDQCPLRAGTFSSVRAAVHHVTSSITRGTCHADKSVYNVDPAPPKSFECPGWVPPRC